MKSTYKSRLTLPIIGGIIIGFMLACGGGKPAPTKYQGTWVGADGSTLYMNSDGKAGFQVGSKKVTGGSAEVDETAKTIKISLFGISQTWKIDQEPDDNGEMKLDGKIYKRK